MSTGGVRPALLGLLVAVLAGCTPVDHGAVRTGPAGDGLVAGVAERTVAVADDDAAGGVRRYRVAVPADVAPSAPLVLVLTDGPGGVSADDATWRAVSERHGVVVASVAPEGDGERDATAADAVLADVAARLDVDPARVYVAGVGVGAAGVSALACRPALGRRGLEPAAYALVGGVAAPCATPRPISLLTVRTAAGAVGSDAASWASPDAPGGCAPPVTTPARSVVTTVARCPDGREVTTLTVPGAQVWRPWTAPTLWRFFAGHPRLR